MKWLFGLLKLITAFTWLALSIAGLIFAPPALRTLHHNLEPQLDLVLTELDLAVESTALTQDLLTEANGTLITVEEALLHASVALSDTRPLLSEASIVVTEDVPTSIAGIRRTLPNIINTMDTVEKALSVLSTFSFVIPNPLGKNFEIGLGVQYQPEIPLGQTLAAINASLEGVPESLAALQDDLAATDENLATLSADLAALSTDLEGVNDELAALPAQLTAFTTSLNETQASVQAFELQLPQLFRRAELALIILLGVVALTQLPTLYEGGIAFRRPHDPTTTQPLKPLAEEENHD